jgi:ribosomal subunit interface protein
LTVLKIKRRGNMEILINSTVEIDKTFKDYLKDKLETMSKFLFDQGRAEVFIKKEGPMFISEINIHSKHSNIFLKEQDNDLNKSLEILMDRLRRNLSKLHDKKVDRK